MSLLWKISVFNVTAKEIQLALLIEPAVEMEPAVLRWVEIVLKSNYINFYEMNLKSTNKNLFKNKFPKYSFNGFNQKVLNHEKKFYNILFYLFICIFWLLNSFQASNNTRIFCIICIVL